MPRRAQEHAGLLAFLEQLVPMIANLPTRNAIAVPLGWAAASRALVLLLHRTDDATFSLTVCNWAEGLDRHPARLDAATGGTQRAASVPMSGVAREQVEPAALCRRVARRRRVAGRAAAARATAGFRAAAGLAAQLHPEQLARVILKPHKVRERDEAVVRVTHRADRARPGRRRVEEAGRHEAARVLELGRREVVPVPVARRERRCARVRAAPRLPTDRAPLALLARSPRALPRACSSPLSALPVAWVIINMVPFGMALGYAYLPHNKNVHGLLVSLSWTVYAM